MGHNASQHNFIRRSVLIVAARSLLVGCSSVPALAAKRTIKTYVAHTTLRVHRFSVGSPVGLSPATIKSIYNLKGSGSGTIAIVGAYDAPTVLADLNTFSAQFGLPQCTATNACFEKHLISPTTKVNSGWALETSLDTQWAHAIAPGAKILLVEAKTAGGSDLTNAVDYTRSQADVVAVSMSWGGSEFASEASQDAYFTSDHSITFFASSGDNGTRASWPAVSPNVIAVGGTTLTLSGSKLTSETAWSGSGGGISAYIPMPAYQATYGVTGTDGKRAVPDVSYDADPTSGVAVYDSTTYSGKKGWFELGGTSAGAPQWAGIRSLDSSLTAAKLYKNARSATHGSFLRDIVSRSNGSCSRLCLATTGYDTVTGLGIPVTSAL